MIKKFSSPKMRNRQFVFAPKIEYQLVAKRREANQNFLTFPFWCPREESNLYHKLRKLVSYPLNDEGSPTLCRIKASDEQMLCIITTCPSEARME